jgi:hypothetical protein
MIKDLVKIANKLDSLGLKKEADFLDSLIKKMAGNSSHRINVEELSTEAPIGFTESRYEDLSPEQLYIVRLKAAERLSNLSDKEFTSFLEKFPEAMDDIFGKGRQHEVKR